MPTKARKVEAGYQIFREVKGRSGTRFNRRLPSELRKANIESGLELCNKIRGKMASECVREFIIRTERALTSTAPPRIRNLLANSHGPKAKKKWSTFMLFVPILPGYVYTPLQDAHLLRRSPRKSVSSEARPRPCHTQSPNELEKEKKLSIIDYLEK